MFAVVMINYRIIYISICILIFGIFIIILLVTIFVIIDLKCAKFTAILTKLHEREIFSRIDCGLWEQ